MAVGRTGLSIWKFSASMAAKLSGGMVGVGTTMATTNPFLGAAVGISIAHTLERVGNEVIDRRLAPRQNVRVGRVIAVAYMKLKEHQDRGERPREDSFFKAGPDDRSIADEVTESALQAAMDSAQEQKVDFIGALLANIIVKQDIDVSTAYFLIEMARSISYRGFVLLKIAGDVDAFGFSARVGEDVPGPPPDLHPLMIEVYELSRRGIIDLKDNAGDAGAYALLGFDEIDPSKVRLSTVGRLLHDNLELVNLDTNAPVYTQTVEQLLRLSRTGKGGVVIGGGTYTD